MTGRGKWFCPGHRRTGPRDRACPDCCGYTPETAGEGRETSPRPSPVGDALEARAKGSCDHAPEHVTSDSLRWPLTCNACRDERVETSPRPSPVEDANPGDTEAPHAFECAPRTLDICVCGRPRWEHDERNTA